MTTLDHGNEVKIVYFSKMAKHIEKNERETEVRCGNIFPK